MCRSGLEAAGASKYPPVVLAMTMFADISKAPSAVRAAPCCAPNGESSRAEPTTVATTISTSAGVSRLKRRA